MLLKALKRLKLLFQFTGLLEFCDHAANLGIVVVVAALSGDFERKVIYLR